MFQCSKQESNIWEIERIFHIEKNGTEIQKLQKSLNLCQFQNAKISYCHGLLIWIQSDFESYMWNVDMAQPKLH